MPNERQNNFTNLIQNNAVAIGAILVVLMLIIPLPSFLLDTFMALNLAI